MPSFVSSLISILVLILILLAAYITARFTGIRMKRMSRSRHMEIVDQIIVAKDRTVLLLKVEERIFVVGLTAQGMNTIAEMSSSELTEVSAESTELGFGTILKDCLQRIGIPRFRKEADINQWTDEE